MGGMPLFLFLRARAAQRCFGACRLESAEVFMNTKFILLLRAAIPLKIGSLHSYSESGNTEESTLMRVSSF